MTATLSDDNRVGIFYASASLSGAFGGLLATGIEEMDGIGGLSGWRWIFILEGLITVLFAVIAAIFLPADIGSAKFFTGEEREFALKRFRDDSAVTSSAPLSEPAQRINAAGMQIEKEDDIQVETLTTRSVAQVVNQEDEKFEWYEVFRGIKEPQVWMTSLSYLGIIVSLYSFSLFLPTIITGLGYSGGQAQLHTVPPYVPAVVLTVAVAVAGDRFRMRGPFILLFLPISIAGYILAIVAKNDTQRYAAVFLIASGM
ncbi:hypothetical protein EVJ58_g3274 [Rhodofomes roseus]|uniref:Major facilitator superfamily (MFS) profile domain-containing protein n=1 Tax=Rhodofomes roseus TaxID=34475 RepID=A0A4Y9YNN5_9APHY|nr:hypothetical protein EVJ58_g3274 [Rhodofomes roseus]